MVTTEERLAFVALGANLDDPAAQLKSALNALCLTEGLVFCTSSSLYSTDPMGPQDQPPYLNAVCSFTCSLGAIELLDRLQTIESTHGRVRSGRRWGARTLDLDLLLLGAETVTDERLTVPHPGITQRSFVLLPLLEIAPSVVIPGLGDAVSYLETVEMFDIVKLEASLEP